MRISLKIIALLLCTISVFAAAEPPFNEIKNSFTELDELENYLSRHPELSLNEVKDQKPELVADLNLVENTGTLAPAAMRDLPLVGGFWYGCCLGVIGLALVYFITDKDRSEVRKALWGCLLFTFLGGGIFGFWNPFGW